MIGNGNPLSPFGAIIKLDIENAKIVEGICFTMRKRFDIAALGVLDIVFDPTNFDKETLVTLPLSFNGIGGPIDIDFYHDVNADQDGTELVSSNRNHKVIVTNPATVVIRQNPSNVNIGGAIKQELLIPSNGSGAGNTSSGDVAEPLVMLLDKTKKCLWRFTNTDNSDSARLGVVMTWFEVPY